MFTLFPMLSMPLAVVLSGKDVWLLALVAVLGLCAGAGIMAWLKREKAELTKVKRVSLDISSFFSQINLPDAADFFKAFSIDDFTGMWDDAQAMVKVIEDPDHRVTVLSRVVKAYIADLKADNDTAELTNLSNLISGTTADAQAAVNKPIDAADLKVLSAVFNAGKDSAVNNASAGAAANKAATAAPV